MILYLYLCRKALITIQLILHNLVGVMVHDGENNRVHGRLYHKGSLRRDREENTRTEHKEKGRDKKGHQNMKHSYIFRL